MAKPLVLLGGAYEARSVIAGAQRCVNLYTEKNPEDAKAPTTHYPTPGFSSLAANSPTGNWRKLYLTRDKQLFGVCSSRLVKIDDRWNLTEVGVLKTAGQKPVDISDNGIDMLIVDGSPFGYTVNLETLEFEVIGEDQNFFGGVSVDYIDTFFVVSEPNSRTFRVSLSNSVEFDPLFFADKTGRSDKLVGLITAHREIWLIGESTTEVWFNAGDPVFPFQIVSGAFVEAGCCAPASIASHGNAILFLSKDDKGQAIVAMSKGYQLERVTTRAIESEFSKFKKVDDAIGLCYQFKGHLFYMLTFPSANQTWVYDLVEGLWHEEVWTDTNGAERRVRPSAVTFAFGKLVAGDRENGKLYFLDANNLAAIGGPLKRLRSMPVISNEGQRINEPVLLVDMEVGEMPTGDHFITLRQSDNFGKTWDDGIIQTLGARGAYDTTIQYRNLGIGRNRVFELSWHGEGPSALNNVLIEPDASDS